MILVTAATGTVGSQVLHELLKRDVNVRAAVHHRPLVRPGVEAQIIDFDRPETLRPALEDVETVFLASYATRHEVALVPAAVEAGVERIVKLSAWQADREAFVVGRWHHEVERTIEHSGLAWTFLRPNSFMQNILIAMSETIREENAIYDSVGHARISHIDARDVARVAAHVITERGHEHRTYTLSGPEAVTHTELADALSRAFGRTITYVPIDDEDYRHALLQQGYPDHDADALVDLNRYSRTGAAAEVTTTVRDVTGRAPVSLSAFCRDHAPALSTQADDPDRR